jgi:hypothetical protein
MEGQTDSNITTAEVVDESISYISLGVPSDRGSEIFAAVGELVTGDNELHTWTDVIDEANKSIAKDDAEKGWIMYCVGSIHAQHSMRSEMMNDRLMGMLQHMGMGGDGADA